MSFEYDVYDSWEREYYAKYKDTFRLGQKFLNDFFPRAQDAKLFYEEDDEKAKQMIFDTYINRGFDLVKGV